MNAFEAGDFQIDPHLTAKSSDHRRGVSLAFRLSHPASARIGEFISELRRILPGQYFYKSEELHVTVLSIVSGNEMWRKQMKDLATVRPIIIECLKSVPPFSIHFRGLTASPGAIMIQGFPEDETLQAVRDSLRESFEREGFGHMLDRRYKIVTAHVTVARFQHSKINGTRLAAFLAANRRRDFGRSEADIIQLLWGDWYASSETIRLLEEFPLE